MPEAALRFAMEWIHAQDRRPELRTVIHLAQVTNLVRDDVVGEVGRELHQPPLQADQRSARAMLLAAAPLRPRVRQLHRRHGQIELEGEAVAYRLIRSRRRSIGIEIASGGALVRAPHWARVGDIHAFMLDNSKWIRTKLHTWRTARAAVRPEDWRDGGTVRYQGQDLRLSVFGSRKRTAFHDLFDLRIGIPKPSAERICEAVEEWLKARAEETFLPRDRKSVV